MSFITQLTEMLTRVSTQLPLEMFVILGSFVEEIIAPLPSPLVMTLAGGLAEAQEYHLLAIVLLALLGAAVKTFGSYIYYILADKAEDLLIGTFGKFFGISHNEVESLGKHFSGGRKDEILIFLFRAIPVLPTSPVSVMAGLIKLPLKGFLLTTFLGLLIRNLIFLYIGYVGLASYQNILHRLESVESILTATAAVVVMLAIAGYWYTKNKERIQTWVEKRLGR